MKPEHLVGCRVDFYILFYTSVTLSDNFVGGESAGKQYIRMKMEVLMIKLPTCNIMD